MLAPVPEAPIRKNRPRGVMAGSAGDSASRVGARAAQVQSLERHSIVRRADQRAPAAQLIEAHLAVEDIAADQSEAALEVQRRMDLPADHGLGETGRMAVDQRDDRVRGLFTLVVPAAAGAKIVAEMLAEHRRDMLTPRSESWVHGRGDDHLDDRLLRPAIVQRMAPCLI